MRDQNKNIHNRYATIFYHEKMLNRLRKKISRYNELSAQKIERLGLTPYAITLLGLIITVISIIPLLYLFGSLKYLVFIALILLAGYMDILDGALARYKDQVSKKGAFTDSTLDRISEVILIVYLYLGGITYDTLLLILLISTSILISYIRARAEALGLEMQGVGLMERAERILFLLLAIFVSKVLNLLDINLLLWLLVILNTYTVLQRIVYTLRKL